MTVEDSQSEGSIMSHAEEEDFDGSNTGKPAEGEGEGTDSAQANPEAASTGSRLKKARKSRKKPGKKSKDGAEHPQAQASFKAMADTEAMMNGLKISEEDQAEEEVLDFDTMGQTGATASATHGANGHAGTLPERQRREHEEYRKKRDSDPAFIPNRGNFFMHDTRGQPNDQAPPPRGAWQGRGRGRGGAGVGGPFSPANQMAQAERAAEQPWKHDLHDIVNEEPQDSPASTRQIETSHDQNNPMRLAPRPSVPPNQKPSRVVSFSSATLVGKVQIRVSLPGMKAHIVFSEVPWKHYIRLPDHRPPLRRDKPVRMSLPGHPPRYIFPSTERSFIFIPRQMRPNQQGYNRAGGYQRSIGGYGYSSRRTSMYGGSFYSASVAASRRSSMAGISRENAFSPVGSLVGMPPSRPVVRLPHGAQPFSGISTPIGPFSGQHTPTGMPQTEMHTFPLPGQPQRVGIPATAVHQPRPQKAISVTGIESPMLQQTPAESQPFQNQLPAHMNEPPPPYAPQAPPPHPYFSPSRQYAYPQPQPQTGTPLSGIPEAAIHAPSFQPPGYSQPPFYPAYAPPPQNFYYSPPATNGFTSVPMYVPPQPGYMMPTPQVQLPMPPVPQPSAALPPPQQPPSQPSESQDQAQSGMVAHESNGMVFYVPRSEAQQSENYQPAESFVPSYAMPGLPPPTPAPEDMTYYYPQMPHTGMQEVGSAVYYPAQQ